MMAGEYAIGFPGPSPVARVYSEARSERRLSNGFSSKKSGKNAAVSQSPGRVACNGGESAAGRGHGCIVVGERAATLDQGLRLAAKSCHDYGCLARGPPVCPCPAGCEWNGCVQ